MSTATPAAKSVAVTGVGLLTLLWGGGYVALGVWGVIAGAGWFSQSGSDPWGPVVTLFGFLPVLIIVIGIVALGLGILGTLAGFGVLRRRPWGRVLTLSLAVFAALVSLASFGSLEQSDSFIDNLLGTPQVLYGILSLVILIRSGSEFSRPRS